nr:uncharacterized protein LOC124818442 [Hydra vulgaris]
MSVNHDDCPQIVEVTNEHEGINIISCEGYLYMHIKSFWRPSGFTVKRKYFTLRKETLFITKQRGDLIFEDGSDNRIDIHSDTGIFSEENLKGKYQYGIRITNGKQSFLLSAANAEYRNAWLSTLLTVVTKKFVHQLRELGHSENFMYEYAQ